jgi:YhcH/YjgK/YiaL family protein
MLVGHIAQLKSQLPLLPHPAWQQAFNWIQNNTGQPTGDYEIDGRDIYASIQTASTTPDTAGKIERHFQYIDIHYCIDGGELISWIPTNQLTDPIETNQQKDYALYAPQKHLTTIRMTPGAFAIFLPKDAHAPKISDGQHTQVKKIVVKINHDIINPR